MKATFKGIHRIDKRVYPEIEIREAIINSITHRDYSISGSNIINVFKDKIEVISLDGLVAGLTLKEACEGVSQARNPGVANILYRLELIEGYGTGLRRIINAFENELLKPYFLDMPKSFKVVLYNCNTDTKDNLTEKEVKKGEERATSDCDSIIIDHARKNNGIKRKAVEEIANVKKNKAIQILQNLCNMQKLKMQGEGKNTKYVVME